jgi:methionyl-tRNA synthetase
MKKFYLTTAIDYANGTPHIGHAYEKILSDTIIRSRRMEGIDCHFLTGLDEHGQKVQEAAEGKGIAPLALCDAVAEDFQKLCRRLSVSYNDYVRTTELRHTRVVQQILQNLYDGGEIYRAQYRGLYSLRAERFVQEREMVDGHWPDDIGEPIDREETNYFFRLSNYQEWLIDFLKKNDDFIVPAFRQKQVLEFLREPLNDLCISRPKARLHWGIEIPFDPGYVTYVWFDALVNYISAVGYGTKDFSQNWPADLHVIGKDILVPAHAVYWPIILHAIGVEQPRQILAHGWWLAKGGAKMSKSLGNTVQPLDYVAIYGPDAFRYFVLREMVVGQDSDFTDEHFRARYTGDLANDLGNLLSRICHMVIHYCGGYIPIREVHLPEEEHLETMAAETILLVRSHCQGLEFSSALDAIFAFLRSINRYAEIRSPWKLAQIGDGPSRLILGTALATMAEALRIAAVLLLPMMPDVAGKILQQLGTLSPNDWLELAWSDLLAGRAVEKPVILFPRVEEDGNALPKVPG